MIQLKYNKNDLRFIFIEGDKAELGRLERHLNKIPSYMFMPSYAGIPKAVVFMHKHVRGANPIYWCHSGLWREIYEWCAHNKVELRGVHDSSHFKYTGFDLTLEAFSEWVKSLKLNIEPRDYQIKAAWLILKYRQSTSQLATRSGKTLIAYIIFRWLIQMEGAHNMLMVVPNISLVKQGVDDMKEYKEFFQTETVWAGSELCDSSNLTIGTFQSLVKRCDPSKKSKNYNPKFFDKFDVILIDECHTAPCDSINLILRQPFVKNVKIRFGFTGTLPKEGSIESFEIQALIGPQIQDIRSKELMDQGYITPVDITQIIIKHPETPELNRRYIECGEYLCGNATGVNLPKEQRKFTMVKEKRLPYSLKVSKEKSSEADYINYLVDLCKANGSNLLMLEQMLVHRDQKRIDIMDDMLGSFHKNCLVFAHHTEYMKYLYNHFKEKFPDKHVYLIKGDTPTKKRAVMMDELLKYDNCILVAAYKCVGTGLTLKNVDYGIFAQSFKSSIITLQSLGRGLCLSEGKDKFYLYDLIDQFPTGRIDAQGKAKRDLYQKQQFDFRVVYK